MMKGGYILKRVSIFRTTHYLFITWKPDISAQKMDSFLYTEEKDDRQRKKGDDAGVKALKNVSKQPDRN